MWSVWYVHEANRISIRIYGDWLSMNLISRIHYSTFSFKRLLWSRGNDETWIVIYFVEKDAVLSHVFTRHSVYCHDPLWSWVVQCVEHLCTWYAESRMNIKAVCLLLLILNCRGRFLLHVFFWKRDIIKFKFLGLSLFIGSLIRTFMWKCHPL